MMTISAVRGMSGMAQRYHRSGRPPEREQDSTARSVHRPRAAMDRQYDLVVIGTGVTSAVASRCREAGWSVAVVDSRPFGGTCALRGCVPKKILVGAAEAVHAARDLADRGVPAGSLTLDWPALMNFKRSLIGGTTERTEQTWA